MSQLSLREFLQPINSLPSTRGSLCTLVTPTAIASANREVERILLKQLMPTPSQMDSKRGSYGKYSPELRAQIAKYACSNGSSQASQYFSQKLGKKVSIATVVSMRKSYLIEKKKADPGVDIAVLPLKKRGRPYLLGELDHQLQAYLRRIREEGGTVTASVVLAAAKGIIMATDPSLLQDYGGHINLNHHWAYALLERMKFAIRRKATTSKSKMSIPTSELARIKAEFLNEIVSVVTMEEIPPELILNWGQTGIPLVPADSWTMDQIGSTNDKRQITAVFCGSMLGEFLPLQLIYKGKTNRCHPHFQFPQDWNVCHSLKRWSTEETMIEYIEEIIVPFIQATRDRVGDLPSLVITDNFKGQMIPAINQLLESHNIRVVLIPPNCTDQLKPMDVAVNKSAKDYLKQQFEKWYVAQVTQQLLDNFSSVEEDQRFELRPVDLSFSRMKELSAKWLVDMFTYLSDNPHVVVSGFVRSGIIPAFGDGSIPCGQDMDNDDFEDDEDDFVDGVDADNDDENNECMDR